jgi:hypothetical protein
MQPVMSALVSHSPFKNRVTHCWEDWTVEKGGLDEEKMKTPPREEVSEWVIKNTGPLDRKLFAAVGNIYGDAKI